MPPCKSGLFRFGFRHCNFYKYFSILVHVHYTSIYSFPEFILHATASICLLVAVAMERYFAILKPFVHLTKAVKSIMWKLILAIWLLAGVLSAPGFVIASLRQKFIWRNASRNTTVEIPRWIEILNTTYSFVIFTFGLILPSVTMICCYTRIIYHMWFNAEANKATNVALLQSRRKLTKLFILVTLIFLIAWTQTFTRLIVLQFVSINEAWKFEMISFLLGLAESTANPVIYSLRCPRFRQEVVKTLTFLRYCKGKRPPYVTTPFAKNRYSFRKTKMTTHPSVKLVSYSTRM